MTRDYNYRRHHRFRVNLRKAKRNNFFYIYGRGRTPYTFGNIQTKIQQDFENIEVYESGYGVTDSSYSKKWGYDWKNKYGTHRTRSKGIFKREVNDQIRERYYILNKI